MCGMVPSFQRDSESMICLLSSLQNEWEEKKNSSHLQQQTNK